MMVAPASPMAAPETDGVERLDHHLLLAAQAVHHQAHPLVAAADDHRVLARRRRPAARRPNSVASRTSGTMRSRMRSVSRPLMVRTSSGANLMLSTTEPSGTA